MKKTNRMSQVFTIFAATLLAASGAMAKPEIGAAAPEFALTDTNGNAVSSQDLVGKTVVLEWTNHGCPYVKKHYKTGNMQALQKQAKEDEIVWISVISSAEGKQGYVSPEEANDLSESRDAVPSHVLLDVDGTIGRAYEARTTPHMFIIDPEGKLAYMGGIDDKPTSKVADIDTAQNYVRLALDEMSDGKTVSTPASRPYGCSVKYSS